MYHSLSFSSAKRMKHVLARMIALGVMLTVLPSCGIPRHRLGTPGPPLPPSFNGATSPENSARVGIEDFYNDRMLLCLIQKAIADNRELRVLNEEVQIASNEILARSGAYLPILSLAAGAGLDRNSRFTETGAGLLADPYLPGKHFQNPHGNFLLGANFTWQLDIYHQLRDARNAATERYAAAAERRNYFVTTLVADVAENFYRLMALDKRLENLEQIIQLQERSLEIAKVRFETTRTNKLGVLRFQAEVQRNQSEKLIVNQQIIQGENRINLLVNRFPQRVDRVSTNFYNLTIHPLSMGVPSELLQNRPDVRQAERDLLATGLDVRVARINFFPQLVLIGGVGPQSFLINHLFEPQAVVGQIAGGLVAPLVNKRAIQAQYLTANARQLQALYNYQRVILEAFTQVTNRLTAVENYTRSIDIKRQQLKTLEAAVASAADLFQNTRIEYIDVLLAQRDLRDARTTLIDTKSEQLSAIVNTYQTLGGGVFVIPTPSDFYGQFPYTHTVREGEDFSTITLLYYRSSQYEKALWAANKDSIPERGRPAIGDKIRIPRIDQLNSALIEAAPPPAPLSPEMPPFGGPALPPPPPANTNGPFGEKGIGAPPRNATGDAMPSPAAPAPTTGK